MIEVRPVAPEDLDFCWEMLGTAAAPGGEPIPPADVAQIDELARYLDRWGRPGDVGVVAVDVRSGRRVGAAWFRLFSATEPGFGWVDDVTPEMAMACVPEARDRGVGRAMVEALLAGATGFGADRLALSVLVDNERAIHLYESCGFRLVEVEEDGQAQTMVAPTARRGE